MKLSYPVTPFSVNQYFGSNGEYYRLNGIPILGHNGLDLQAFHGQPIYAAHDGDADYEVDDKGGCGVVITNKSLGIKTIYWHMVDGNKEPKYKSPIDNNRVNPVKASDLIGFADSTGLSTGNHLHFGLKYINSRGETLNSDNGYLGAIDPMQFFNQPNYYFNVDFGFPAFRFGDVLQLQKILVAEGCGKFTPTGFFGPLTLAAVKVYQRKHGIPQTGYVGPLTRGALNQ